ncbi:MAG: amidohydrolase family protein, partial [Vicinamibacteria bacterium]
SPRLIERWRSGSGRRREQGAEALTPGEYAEVKQSAQGWVTFAGLAHTRGIRVLTGTDTPVEWVIPGHSLHQELEFMVRGGISPVEAIRCSTGTAAEAFRTPDQGTIHAGHVADLVIVRGNVATDITSVQQVEKVILGGRVLEPTELLEEAKRLMASQANGSAVLRRLSARRSGSPRSP